MNLPNTLTDHASLIGIIRMPGKCINKESEIDIPVIVKDGDNWKTAMQKVQVAKEITSVIPMSEYYYPPKHIITDFYPYTYYMLTDGECEPLILHPQYLPDKVSIVGKVALSNAPIERYYIRGEGATISGYKGDITGTIYNITNTNLMMLPTATNEGINYMTMNSNSINQTNKSNVSDLILNGVTGVATTVGASIINPALGASTALSSFSSAMSSINNIKNTDARNKDMMLSPNSISSFGTPSTRQAFGTNNVRLLKFSVSERHKSKIISYTQRFGYKFNNFATVDLKQYKGYIKMVMPDVNATFDNDNVKKIIEILERGIKIE